MHDQLVEVRALCQVFAEATLQRAPHTELLRLDETLQAGKEDIEL